MKALDRGLSQTGGASLEQKPFPLSKDGKINQRISLITHPTTKSCILTSLQPHKWGIPYRDSLF